MQGSKIERFLHTSVFRPNKDARHLEHFEVDTSLQEETPRDINEEIPDGGLEAWLVVLGGWCCNFCTFGWTNATGVFQDYYQTELFPSLSPATIAWIPSLENFFIFAGGPVWGLVHDNYGPRWLLLIGSFLHVFGLMMASISDRYYLLVLSQGFCSPIGAGMILYPAISSIFTWFHRWRGLALGLISTGASIGGLVFPLLFDYLTITVGFGWAMRICSFVILILMLIANLTVKSRVSPKPKRFKFNAYLIPFQDPTYRLLAGSTVLYLGIFLPTNYLIVQARQEGMPDYLAGKLLVILNGLSIFGRTFPAYASDLVGRYNIMILASSMSTLIVWIIWVPLHGDAAVITFASLYGACTGAVVSLIPALVSQITAVQDIGVRTGTLYGLIALATLISNPLAGALVDAQHGQFIGLKIFCGVMWTLGVLFLVVARASIVGWGLKAKV